MGTSIFCHGNVCFCLFYEQRSNVIETETFTYLRCLQWGEATWQISAERQTQNGEFLDPIAHIQTGCHHTPYNLTVPNKLFKPVLLELKNVENFTEKALLYEQKPY